MNLFIVKDNEGVFYSLINHLDFEKSYTYLSVLSKFKKFKIVGISREIFLKDEYLQDPENNCVEFNSFVSIFDYFSEVSHIFEQDAKQVILNNNEVLLNFYIKDKKFSQVLSKNIELIKYAKNNIDYIKDLFKKIVEENSYLEIDYYNLLMLEVS